MGFTYKLSDKTMEAIQAIADQVGAPEYVRTPQFPKTRQTRSGSGTRKKTYEVKLQK